MNQIEFRPIKQIKMTVWTSVLWKISIQLAKKWPDMVVKKPFSSIVHFYSDYSCLQLIQNSTHSVAGGAEVWHPNYPLVDYRSFYPSEPFTLGHFNVRYPVSPNSKLKCIYISGNSRPKFKAEESHFKFCIIMFIS